MLTFPWQEAQLKKTPQKGSATRACTRSNTKAPAPVEETIPTPKKAKMTGEERRAMRISIKHQTQGEAEAKKNVNKQACELRHHLLHVSMN